jgi:hypothetical protein
MKYERNLHQSKPPPSFRNLRLTFGLPMKSECLAQERSHAEAYRFNVAAAKAADPA